MNLNNRFILVIVVFFFSILISIPIIYPYLNNGYFPTHDGEWAVIRLADMFRSLRDFQFPVRYSGALNFGYGYPLFNFAYPYPYYTGVLLYFVFGSFVTAIKSLFVLSVVFSSFFMFYVSYELWKSKTGAFASAAIYIYLPYRILDLFVRGSIGESIALALFPLIFFLTLRLFEKPFSRVIVISLSLSTAYLIGTHNIMTVLFMPWFAVFILGKIFFEKRFDVLQTFLLSLFLGIGSSAFFWIPAIFEKSNILLSTIPIADRSLYFVNLEKLFIPSWGYAPPTEKGGFSYNIGVGQILIIVSLVVSVFILFIKKSLIGAPKALLVFSLLLIYFALFLMMFPFTAIIWQHTPLISEINYPWTILSQLGFISALSIGYLFTKGKIFKILVAAAVILALVEVLPNSKPGAYVNRGDSYYLTNEGTTTSSDELMPLWVKEKPKNRYNEKVEIIEGNATISDLKYNSKSLSFSYSASSDTTFRVNTIYYPGWNVYIDYEKVEIDYDNNLGVMDIKASQYRKEVTMTFDETPIRTVANIISIFSLLTLAFIALRSVLSFR